MRTVFVRLAAVGAAVTLVASCDTRLPTSGGITGTSTSSSNPSKGNGPTITIDSPTVGTLINTGDSVLVTVRLHDAKALRSANITGYTQKGSVDLGTFSQTARYKTVSIPGGGVFRPNLRDTTVRRYLQPINPADTSLDSLIIVVIATDTANLADTVSRRVDIVAGPKVTVASPTNGDSVPAGVGLSVGARAQHPTGVGRIDIRVQGEKNWPTKLDTTFTQVYSDSPRDITFNAVARIPLDAPLRGRVTITATAVDVNRQPGSSSPVAVFVRSASSAQPRVTQTVSAKSETSDSVVVRATGEGITTLGVIIRDSSGTIVQTDSLMLPAPYNANVQASIPLNLLPSLQGKKLGLTGFAVDQAGRIGYAVPATKGSSEGNINFALVDSTLVVYGHTYALPHNGVVGDVVVDAARGNVFLSNTNFNLLEVWQTGSKSFVPNGVAVGSMPWGMFISNNPDTLLVANSGGTNISRVYIGSQSAGAIHEDLAHRILTRATYAYSLTVSRDENTGKIRLSAQGPNLYSDRPQYIAQAAAGRIYYSTRPTQTAPAGTIRWIDPSLPAPDPRQVWQYGTIAAGTAQTYALFNVDSISIHAALPTSTESDTLFLWDHPYGQKTGVIAVSDVNPMNAIAAAVAGGSDAEAILRLDQASLGLTDTTFVAVSGNRNWIAFGEGHTGGTAGRVMMVKDSAGAVPNFFSPLVTVQDLTNNASEQVFGLALDQTGGTIASHGLQSYFAMVVDPFHLRLQGKYDTADNGAGIAFHPKADGILSSPDKRLAFVGSASGVVEIVDIAYYIARGKLQLKAPIYGPLRTSGPMPGDAPDVVLKLYALSKDGLIVVDVTASDIKPGPP
jgi:hypothetical protein